MYRGGDAPTPSLIGGTDEGRSVDTQGLVWSLFCSVQGSVRTRDAGSGHIQGTTRRQHGSDAHGVMRREMQRGGRQDIRTSYDQR
jgi:hypothetical protein